MDHEQHEMSENREMTSADMYQALPRLTGIIASDRAEEIRSFSQKSSQREFFVKKKKEYHAAAGESGFHLVKHLV
ncbi:MAG: hypothetical protein ACLFVO_05260 [Chloroflexaceae bacterium]